MSYCYFNRASKYRGLFVIKHINKVGRIAIASPLQAKSVSPASNSPSLFTYAWQLRTHRFPGFFEISHPAKAFPRQP
jgi:hypothetical protein